MQGVEAEAVETGCTFQSSVNIDRVHLEWGRLVVTLLSGGDRKAVSVTFGEIIGFRVLDEGGLLEFRPACSASNGWLFLIHKNGWFDQEASRAGFLRNEKGGLSEYFIASQNECVSVLAGEVPVIDVYSI